jgi:hypothetical protein
VSLGSTLETPMVSITSTTDQVCTSYCSSEAFHMYDGAISEYGWMCTDSVESTAEVWWQLSVFLA